MIMMVIMLAWFGVITLCPINILRKMLDTNIFIGVDASAIILGIFIGQINEELFLVATFIAWIAFMMLWTYPIMMMRVLANE